MSQYEALLEEVRCLRRKAQHVQQLAAPLISSSSQPNPATNAVAITEQVSVYYSVLSEDFVGVRKESPLGMRYYTSSVHFQMLISGSANPL